MLVQNNVLDHRIAIIIPRRIISFYNRTLDRESIWIEWSYVTMLIECFIKHRVVHEKKIIAQRRIQWLIICDVSQDTFELVR